MSQRKAGVILSYISMLFGNLISIIYTPIMLRLLGQSQFGLYQLVASVISYLGLFNFGFGSAYIRYYSQYKVQKHDEKIRHLNGMFLTIFIVIGIIALLTGAVLVSQTQNIFGEKLLPSEIGTAKILMGIMVVQMSISFPMMVFQLYVTANEAYLFQRVLSMIRVVFSPFLTLPVLLLGFQSIGLVLVSACLGIILDCVNMMYCFRKLKIQFLFLKFDWILFKELAIFSSFIFVNMVIDQINWNVDKFILGMFKGTVAVAIYGLATQINTYYMSFSTSISSVFIPKINRMVIEADDFTITELFTKIGRIQFMVLSLILMGFCFFGQPFISLWAGINYLEAYPIVLWLILPVTIPLIQTLGLEILRAKNMHKFRAIVYLFIAIGNIVISIPLCRAMGGLGCAIGTGIALFIGNGIVMNIYYHKKVGINIIFFWRQIVKMLPALILPLLVGVGIMRLISITQIKLLLVYGLIYIGVFCISFWIFGMNQYERNLIKQIISKISSINLKLNK